MLSVLQYWMVFITEGIHIVIFYIKSFIVKVPKLPHISSLIYDTRYYNTQSNDYLTIDILNEAF